MSELGKTASITLITGLPGSGKTLRMVHWIDKAVNAGEIVFVANLNGLKVSHIPFEDPRKWRDLPSGSVLVVDEAQQFFRTRRGGDAPEYITAMETIRHMGVRLIIATQQPDYLDSHLRGLVGLHEHLVREGGKDQVKIFRNPEVMDNVRSAKARARYDSEVWGYPKRIFDLYQSAEVHTVKPTMTARMKRGIIGAIVLVLVVSGVVYALRRDGGSSEKPATKEATSRESARPSASILGGWQNEDRNASLTAVEKHGEPHLREYFENLRPRSPSLPWSAPIYDGRAAVAEPRVFCMVSGAGLDASGQQKAAGYTCITEQGSHVVLPEANAQLLARRGEPYNPFKQQPINVQATAGQLGALVPEAPEGRESRSMEISVMPGASAGRPSVDPTFGTITRPSL